MFKNLTRALVAGTALTVSLMLAPSVHAATPLDVDRTAVRCNTITGDVSRSYSFSFAADRWSGVRARIGVTISRKGGQVSDSFRLRNGVRVRSFILPAREYATMTVTVNGRVDQRIDIAPVRGCWDAHLSTTR